MAYEIKDDCINCGACEPECPESVISEPEGSQEFYSIEASGCTECEGFHDEPQCVAVCPVDAIVQIEEEDPPIILKPKPQE